MKNKIALESQVKCCIAAKPNNLLSLQTVCHCYDGDVETVFFFSFFPFFSTPLQKFPTPSESNKKISFTQSQFEFLHAYLPMAIWNFCVVKVMPVTPADGPNHRHSHSDVLTRLKSILAFNICTIASMNCLIRDKQRRVFMYLYVHTHTHTQTYTVRKLLNASLKHHDLSRNRTDRQ